MLLSTSPKKVFCFVVIFLLFLFWCFGFWSFCVKKKKKTWNVTTKCRWYRAWTKFILVWAVYSSFFTPFEFGFFRGLEEKLFILDVVGQVAFLLDIILQFFLAYRDGQTYRMVYKRTPIALRLVYSFHSNCYVSLCNCLSNSSIYIRFCRFLSYTTIVI